MQLKRFSEMAVHLRHSQAVQIDFVKILSPWRYTGPLQQSFMECAIELNTNAHFKNKRRLFPLDPVSAQQRFNALVVIEYRERFVRSACLALPLL